MSYSQITIDQQPETTVTYESKDAPELQNLPRFEGRAYISSNNQFLCIEAAASSIKTHLTRFGDSREEYSYSMETESVVTAIRLSDISGISLRHVDNSDRRTRFVIKTNGLNTEDSILCGKWYSEDEDEQSCLYTNVLDLLRTY